MKESDDLFQLIKSLIRSEKIYFKKSSGLHGSKGDSNYVKLFDAIDAQTNYNEQKLLKKFKSEKFAKNISASKYYLFQLILKSLSNFHAANNSEIQVREMINRLFILNRKGLNKPFYILLKKAKKLAANKEMLPELLTLLRWEEPVMRKMNTEESEHWYDENMHEKKDCIELLRNSNIVRYANQKIKNIGARGMTMFSDKQVLQKLEKLKLMVDELEIVPEQQVFRTQHNYYDFLSSYAFHKGDVIGHFINGQRMVELFASSHEKQHSNAANYLSVLNNYLNGALTCYRFDEIKKGIEKMQKLAGKHAGLEIQARARVYLFKLYIFAFKGKFAESQEFLKETQNWLENNDESLEPIRKTALYQQFAYLYFGMNDYEHALDWCNETLLEKHDSYLTANMMLLRLIIHFELKNYTILESLIKSTYRYVLKQPDDEPLEVIVFKHLRKLSRLFSKKEIRKSLIAMKSDLVNNAQTETEQFSLYHEAWFHWITAKIENKSMSEVVQANYDFYKRKMDQKMTKYVESKS